MNNAVSKKKTAEIIPFSSMFEEDKSKGFESMSESDQATPRLKVLQPLSEELEDLENAKPGDIYNNVTNEFVKGKDGITVIPCAYTRQYVEWKDRGKESLGAPVNIYPAGSDILTKTTRDQLNKDRLENGNYVETCANHFVLVIKDSVAEPAVITMKATQLKKSRKWNTMMTTVKMEGANGLFTPPMFSKFYTLKTIKEENDQGFWFGWDITAKDFLSEKDKDLYAMAKEFSIGVDKGDTQVNHEIESDTKKDSPY